MKKKKINPRYGIGDYHILFTTQEGGKIEFISFGEETKNKFDELKENTYLEYRPGDLIRRIYPAMAMLVRVKDAHDFVIDQFNGEYRAVGTTVDFKTKR